MFNYVGAQANLGPCIVSSSYPVPLDLTVAGGVRCPLPTANGDNGTITPKRMVDSFSFLSLVVVVQASHFTCLNTPSLW